MSPIAAQTQPTHTSCTQACLAMVLGAPVEEVLKVYPQPMGQTEMIQALYECGVMFNVISLGALYFEGYYLAGVPSLNHPGVTHQVIFECDFTHEDGHALHVFDPNFGRDGAKCYARDGSDIRSWFDLIRFAPGGRLPAAK